MLWKRRRAICAVAAMLENLHHPRGEVRIGVVGKYVALEDAYKSLREALMHGGLAHNHSTVIEWIEREEMDSLATAAQQRLAHVTASSCRADLASAASRA